MKTILFSTYDAKSKCFSAPFSMLTIGMALREFEEASRNPNSILSKYPNDFSLYEIGTYDDSNAIVENKIPMNLIAVASEFLKRQSPETMIDEATRKMHSDQMRLSAQSEKQFSVDEKEYFKNGTQPANANNHPSNLEVK